MDSDSQDSEGEDLGTIRPTLIRELRNILDLYPDDGQILKELVQNAEDAGASVVQVLTDKRHFNQVVDGRTLKNHPHLKFFKGPALCVYNDAEFSESDWEGIRMLHTSIKEDDPLKVGRFGLGFKSVFHLTDRLVILSGDYIMYMDPFKGEDRYCNRRRVAGRKGKELQSLLQSLGGAFGITEGTFQARSGHFPGTLFWFPLRLSASDLSSTLYTDQNVENLLASFRTEAPSLLLFLNRVQRVQILVRDDAHDPEECFSVGLAPSCLGTVQRERDRFIKDLTSAGASLPLEETFCITEVVMETSNYVTSQKTSGRWLVANYHCGQRQMSSTLARLLSDHGLCYRPYVGVAIPLSGHDQFQSQLFCFLPLPLDTRSPTGLPVHVHGYFALEQNRRHLKWPTADQMWNNTASDPASLWNCLLVKELLPVVYRQALIRLQDLCRYDPDTFYKAWPDVSRVQDRWKPLLEPLYSRLTQQPLFFSQNLGKQWVAPHSAVLQQFSRQFAEDVKQSVVKVYTANKHPLVVLPQHILNTLKQLSLLRDFHVIRASVVSTLLPHCLPQLQRLDKLNLLQYLSHIDMGLLLDQPLLPLADEVSFGTFRRAGSGWSPMFLCPRQLVQLFPGLEGQFCDVSVPRHVRDDLQRLTESGIFLLEELRNNDRRIPMLLQTSLEARFGVGHPKMTVGDPWIQQVWKFLSSVPNLSSFSHITLLPAQVDRHHVSLLPLTGTYVSSSTSGLRPLSAAMAGVLPKLGITVLHELPDYVTRHNGLMGSYVNYPSTEGILRAIHSVSKSSSLKKKVITKFYTEATTDDKKALILFLSSVGNFCGALPSLFRQLPLFRTVFTNETVSLDQVSYIAPSPLPPIPAPVSLLSCDPSERQAALCLGATEMTLLQIAHSIMKGMCSNACQYSDHDVMQFMKYFLQTKTLLSDSALLRMSQSIRFVRTESGKLQLPGNVYDPSSTLLQDLLHSHRQVKFPCGDFVVPDMLKKLKKLGLRSENELTSDDLLTAANTVSELWWRNDTALAMKCAEALFQYLNRYIDTISTDTLNAISTIQCLPCLQDHEKSAHYPRSLPVRSSPLLVRPADMYSYTLLTVIGSVAPVGRPDMCVKLADHCVRKEATSRDVLQHLKTVISHFQQQEVSQYKLTLNDIFRHLTQIMNDQSVIMCLQSEKCVLIESGESFVCPTNFWIQRQVQDIDLRPYRFPLPVEMKEMTALMEECGSSKSQTDQLLQAVLQEIQSKHSGHDVSPSDFQTDLQLVKIILEALKKSQATRDGSTLLPVIHQQNNELRFKPARECTVIPGMKQSNAPLDVGFEIHIVHPDVSSNTALDLGACEMSERALTGLEDLDFGYEQHEDLTTRLHGLLHESYTDGFSVPKELIQNADDACASKVCFLLDERENMHCRTNLIKDTMISLQGPAVWAYNDAMFSKSDFENIIRLGAGTKKEDTSKVGRFGLGFNAVYNLTDVPCFISGHIMAMFDPQVKYLRNGAGLRLDFTKPINKALLSTMPEQFQPFQDVFGCSLRGPDVHYPGTLFRFPLRTDEQAVNNKLKSESYSESKRRDFLKMLLEKAGSLLLFTQNVREVEVFYIPSHCSDPNRRVCLLSVKKTCLATVVSEPQIRMNNETVLQFMKDNWSDKNCNIKIQQKLEIELTVTEEASSVCRVEKSKSSVHWQVAWASGVDQSARMVFHNMGEGLVPLAATAISVSDHGLIPLSDNPAGFYNTGHLFCFLPLPEDKELCRIALPVHVNGTFALSSDRRGLIVQTEDDLSSKGSSWNRSLYSDAVCRAYLLLLQQVTTEAAADSGHGRYFDLWPRAGVPCLVNSFYHHLQTDGDKVLPVPGQNIWVSFTDAVFLQPDFRDADCGGFAWNALRKFWKGPGYLVDVPSDICELMMNKGSPEAFSAKVITKLAFYRDFFFPNLQSEWWKPEERDHLIYYAVMQNNKDINQLIKDIACIPCQGGKLLRKPNELVSPKGRAAKLFLTSEQRFPQAAEQGNTQTAGDQFARTKTDFCSERTLYQLSQLGMITDVLSWEMVLDRARSVGQLNAEKKVEQSVSRAFSLIEYLSVSIGTNSASALENCPHEIKQLMSQTAFLPVLRKPSDWPFPWAGDETVCQSPLASPEELCLEAMKNLVACRKKLLDMKALRPSEVHAFGKIRKVLGSLGVVTGEDCLNVNLFECVVDQLLGIANQHNQNPAHIELTQTVSSSIYTFLNNCVKRNEDSTVQSMHWAKLTDRCIVWTGRWFVHPSVMAFHCMHDCAPHLYKLGDSQQSHKNFFQAVGVKERFTNNDVLLVLERLNRESSGGQLSTEDIDLVSRIAQLLADTARYWQQSEDLDTDRVFLPDWQGFMHQACKLCVDDPNWQTKTEGMKFVNEKISMDTARLLGVKTKQRQHYSMLTTPVHVKPFGQFEKLTTRIGRLLEGYTFDSSLCKDLLQNADDAQATEAKFIMDFRCLPKDQIPLNFESFQGPALSFYNNKSFTTNDMEGIQNLGVGSKWQDDLKIGQFGVGFNAVFHITDIPSFWTKVDDKEDVICVLDPNCQYVPDAEPTKPGVQFSQIGEVKEVYPDFFLGYLGDAIDSTQPGTLFRFPLRTDEMAEKSEINKKAVTSTDITKLLEEFKDEISTCLLFLNNIQTVGIYSICEDGTLKRAFEVNKVVDETNFQQLINFKTSLQQASVKKQNVESVKEIRPFEAVVLSKIEDSSGDSVDWLTVHRVGFAGDVDVSPRLEQEWSTGNFQLLPCGGVAIKLKAEGPKHDAEHCSQDKYQAFCMLPLPVFTGLPVHVNGHFALDHETRRNLWDGGTTEDDIRSEWNNAIALQVIVPAYITALMRVKCVLFPDNGQGLSSHHMTSALKQYHGLFPRPVGDTFWVKMIHTIYKTIAREELPLFPVICTETPGIEWTPAVRKHSFPGYFSNLVVIFTNQKEKRDCRQGQGQVFLSGGISASSVYGRTNDPSPSETAKEMQDLLKRLNMKILETPVRIFENFKSSGVNEVQEVTADTVLEFLRSSGQAVIGGCNIHSLPRQVTDTPLKTASNVEKVVRFVCKAANFLNQLNGIPLCLRQSGTLHVFSAAAHLSQPIISEYYYLLPGSAEEFLHESIIRFFTNLKMTKHVLQALSISMFACRLPKTLTDPCFSAGRPCNFESRKLPPVPGYGKTWLAEVWKFFEEELEKLFQQNNEHGGAVKLDNCNVGELRERAREILLCLSEWCLVPVRKREWRQDKMMLYPLKDLQKIVYLPCSQDPHYPILQKVLEKLPLPFLNTLHLSALNRIPDNLVASISHPRALLHALASCANELSASRKDGREILDYFSKTLNTLQTQCADTRQLKKELRSLPVFPAVGENLVSLPENAEVLCLNHSVPEDGLRQWSGNSSSPLRLLRAEYVPHVLQKFLDFSLLTSEDFYSRYLLPTFDFLPQEAILHHMTFLRNTFNWNKDSEDSNLIQQLRKTAFISAHGVLYRAENFFSPHNSVFQAMCSAHQFPPEPYNTWDWKEFMTVAGIISQVTPDMFLDFARRVESEGRERITPNVADKSRKLIHYLFCQKHLIQSSLLSKVKDIRFVLPSEWSSSPDHDQLARIAHPFGPARLISFSESAFEEHLHVVWSSSWVLRPEADPRRYIHDESLQTQVLSWLGLHQNPPTEKVIQHLKNLSQVLTGEQGHEIFESLQQSRNLLVNIMGDIYRYLEENIHNCDIPYLREMPLVCDFEKKQMLKPVNIVVELREAEVIRGHIEKAPQVFGRYFELFKKLGATQSVTANHYAKFLAWQKTESGETPLHVEELKLVKTALERLFWCLKEGSEEQKRIAVSSLYLPTEEKSLQKSTEIVYRNGAFRNRFKERLENMYFFLGFKNLEMTVTAPLEEINLLPREHQMVKLSDVVKETMPEIILERANYGTLSRNIMSRLENPLTKAAIVRLVYNEFRQCDRDFTSESAQDVERKLSNVSVKEITGLITQITLQGQAVPGSEKSRQSFVDSKMGPPRQAVVYLETEGTQSVDIFFERLADAVNYVLETHLKEIHLIRIFQNPTDAKDILDRASLDDYDYGANTAESVFPAAGKFIPQCEHCYLDNNFYIFRENEHVGYEVYDPVVENQEEGFPEATFIYAIVMEVCDESVPLLARRYRIYLGMDRGEAEVSATQLYKFIRKHPAIPHTRSASTEVVRHERQTGAGENQPPQDKRQTDAGKNQPPQDMKSVLKEIRAILTEAWQQLPDERDRRRVMKRLVLKWHPDRNHGNEAFCTRVTQKIFHYIELLNEGKPLPSDTDSDDEESTRSMFNSSFYANMTSRARAYSTYYNSGPDFSTGRSAHGSDSGWRNGDAWRPTNPQPGEARRWFRQAKADVAVAQAARGLYERGHNWICYQCHQAVEKAMKAVIYFRDAEKMFMQSHALSQLAVIVGDSDIITMVRDIERRLGQHTRMRYPDVLGYPRVPADEYTEDDASWACDVAARVLERVQSLINV
ncbi:sacsin-like [Babylonia areolata]|uniref:sacsin-like n=1 Tax=Babylonia areolata TaxID=304850 RepID=UPI003FCFE687